MLWPPGNYWSGHGAPMSNTAFVGYVEVYGTSGIIVQTLRQSATQQAQTGLQESSSALAT